MVLPQTRIPPWKSEKGDQDLMDKIIPHCCPRCNSKKLYKYGKDKFGNQKYQCRVCKHQFALGSISSGSMVQNHFHRNKGNILPVLFVAKQHFFITITMIILIIAAVIKNAIILSSKQNLRWKSRLLCLTSSAKMTSSVCDIAFILLLLLLWCST